MRARTVETATAEAPASDLAGRSRATLAGLIGIAVAGALVGALPQLGVSSYGLSVLYTIAFYTAVAQSWNLISGFTGYFSFAHGALVGVGSYAGLLAVNKGANMPVMIVAGMLAAFLASVLIGIPSLRLRGIAFAFATVFFQLIILRVVEKAKWLTEGPQGLASMRLVGLPELLVAMTIIATLATSVVFVVRRTRLGLRLLAIKDDETAAAVIGIPTVRLKLAAFGVSALVAGAAGAVHGLFLATLFPTTVFHLQGSLEPVVIALVGGSGSAFGPVFMAAIYGLSQESLRGFGAAMQLIVLGLVLVLATLFARDGLAGLVLQWRDRWRERKQNGDPGE